jgi:hypothetical protein
VRLEVSRRKEAMRWKTKVSFRLKSEFNKQNNWRNQFATDVMA